MAKKAQTVAELLADTRTLEEIESVQTGSEETVSDELSKLEQMMNDVSGVKEGEIIFWLHRANEKNKSLHGAFLKRYPREAQFIDIHEECRDLYGGGDFVLLAKKDGIIYRKSWFPVEAPLRPVGAVVEPPKPPEDPFARLSGAIEKSMIFDRAAAVMGGNKNTVETPKGADPVMTIVTTMMAGMQQQNTDLLKLMLANKTEPKGGNDALMDAIRLGVSISGGKVPLEEGGEGILDMLKPLIPHIPAVIAALTGRGPGRVPVPPRPVPPRPGAPAPAIAAHEAAGPPIPTEPSPPTPEDAHAVVMRRIVDEIRFVMTLPATPKLREHVIDYIDAYMPDVLRQAEMTTPELFAGYVVTLDPTFAGQEQFFIDLHKQYMAGIEVESTEDMIARGVDPFSSPKSPEAS